MEPPARALQHTTRAPSSAVLCPAPRVATCCRLRATFSALQSQQAWVWNLQGGFNEQALSNIVYAYEKAAMLDRELLHWVFSVAALRLDRRDAPPSFKPQVRCSALRRGFCGTRCGAPDAPGCSGWLVVPGWVGDLCVRASAPRSSPCPAAGAFDPAHAALMHYSRSVPLPSLACCRPRTLLPLTP